MTTEDRVLGRFRGKIVTLRADGVIVVALQEIEPPYRWLNGSFANWLERRGIEVAR